MADAARGGRHETGSDCGTIPQSLREKSAASNASPETSYGE